MLPSRKIIAPSWAESFRSDWVFWILASAHSGTSHLSDGITTKGQSTLRLSSSLITSAVTRKQCLCSPIIIRHCLEYGKHCHLLSTAVDLAVGTDPPPPAEWPESARFQCLPEKENNDHSKQHEPLAFGLMSNWYQQPSTGSTYLSAHMRHSATHPQLRTGALCKSSLICLHGGGHAA